MTPLDEEETERERDRDRERERGREREREATLSKATDSSNIVLSYCTFITSLCLARKVVCYYTLIEISNSPAVCPQDLVMLSPWRRASHGNCGARWSVTCV